MKTLFLKVVLSVNKSEMQLVVAAFPSLTM